MANTIFQQPLLAVPAIGDVIPIGHQADGIGYSVTLEAVGSLIGGGGSTLITQNTSFNNLLYNYGYFVSAAGGSSAANNATAMTNMTNLMSNSTPIGGWAWVPQFNYPINFVTNGFSVANQSFIIGLGTGGTGASHGGAPDSFHFVSSGDGLLFSCAGAHTSGGSYFVNLAMKNNSATATSTCAIYAGQWNVRALKCNFYQYPVAFYADALSSGMEQCTVQYGNGSGGPVAGGGTYTLNGCNVPQQGAGSGNPYQGQQPVMAILSAPQVYAVGPGEYFQISRNNGGPVNVCGIGVGGNGGPSGGPVEHAVVRDLHISDFTWGISYVWNVGNIVGSPQFAGSNGTKGCVFSSLEIQAWSSAVLMVSPDTGGAIYGDKYTDCFFQKSSNSTDASSIVYVDATTNGGSNNNVNDIGFTNCTFFNGNSSPVANTYGLQIFSGSNIRVLGCTIGGMGTNANGSANICISGGAGRVYIQNSTLRQQYPNGASSNVSQYGVLISGTPAGPVTIESCDFGTTYTPGNVINVTGTVNTGVLFVRNCTGYNDQQTNILGNGTILINTNYAAYNLFTKLAGTAINYYGPSYIMFTANAAGGTYQVNGGTTQTLLASQVVVQLLNSPYDVIRFGGNLPTNIVWVGE